MRMLINGFKDYLQWRECQSGCGWRDMMNTRLKERPIRMEEAKTHGARAAQLERELMIAREIFETSSNREERLMAWKARTGKSETALYRRLDQLRQMGLL
jgi:hypothetical protein